MKKLNEVNKSRLNISSQIKKTSKAIKKQNLDNLNEKLHTEYEAFKDEGDSIMAKLDRENLRKQKIEISPIKEPILSTKLNMPLHAAIENLNYNVKSNQKHPTGIVILDNPLSTEGRYRTDHGRSFEDFSIINSFNERLLKLKSNLGKDYNLGLNSQSRKVPKKVIHSTVFQRLGLTISHSKLPRTRKF